MVDGASDAELDAVGSSLGVELPAELRGLLRSADGFEAWYGDVFLKVYGAEDLIAVNAEVEGHPGFLAFASDGSRELIGFDLRRSPPPIVMIDITSEGWHEALLQARSLAEFMERRGRGEPLDWTTPYEPDGPPGSVGSRVR